VTLETLWFALVAFALVAYVVLDGFDIGVGVLTLAIARSDEERRTLIDTIKPVWDGNEVWLLGAGGALYFAFPKLYASSFSGFYLPLMIVLWLLILRALGIELRTLVQEPLWWPLLDVVFTGSSLVLAVALGLAAGNVVRGVPLGADGYFFEPLWTTFTVGPNAGVVDWYTLLIGLLALATLTVHGGCYAAIRTGGDVRVRAVHAARRAWSAVAMLTIASLAATLSIRPAVLDNFARHPWGWVIPIVVAAALAYGGRALHRGRAHAAFAASAAYIASMLGGAAFALHPVLLPASTDPAYSLTIYNTETGRYSMTVGLIWWAVGTALATIYFIVLYRSFRGSAAAPIAGAGGRTV
jgi:cytochrome bd ubiquinol oxidase subunit II